MVLQGVLGVGRAVSCFCCLKAFDTLIEIENGVLVVRSDPGTPYGKDVDQLSFTNITDTLGCLQFRCVESDKLVIVP